MIETVAVLSPGDMGHAIGRTLRDAGRRVITSLRGRSERTVALARAAGLEDVPDDETLVREADVLLAVLVPARAADLAERIAGALRATGASLVYADLNAIAPQTVRAIGETLEATGARSSTGGSSVARPGRGAPGPGSISPARTPPSSRSWARPGSTCGSSGTPSGRRPA
jgi:hypothetical protein